MDANSTWANLKTESFIDTGNCFDRMERYYIKVIGIWDGDAGKARCSINLASLSTKANGTLTIFTEKAFYTKIKAMQSYTKATSQWADHMVTEFFTEKMVANASRENGGRVRYAVGI